MPYGGDTQESFDRERLGGATRHYACGHRNVIGESLYNRPQQTPYDRQSSFVSLKAAAQ
jgi:hypothetical protein